MFTQLWYFEDFDLNFLSLFCQLTKGTGTDLKAHWKKYKIKTRNLSNCWCLSNCFNILNERELVKTHSSSIYKTF